MTDLRKAAEMALEALEELKKDITGKGAPEHWDAYYAKQMYALDALDALRQALAQQALADSIRPKGKSITKVWVDEIKQALAQPEQSQTSGYAKKIESLIKERDELRQQLAKGEQEPVAWMYVNEDGECEQIEYGVSTVEAPYITLLYIATVSKPWVSLTKDDYDIIFYKHDCYDDIARAIETALRSKNNG